jgi:hypothetical protein
VSFGFTKRVLAIRISFLRSSLEEGLQPVFLQGTSFRAHNYDGKEGRDREEKTIELSAHYYLQIREFSDIYTTGGTENLRRVQNCHIVSSSRLQLTTPVVS